MRHRVRLAIALTVLTGLFCADRTALPAPATQPEPGLAQRLVARLSATVRLVAQRRPGVVRTRPESVQSPTATTPRPTASPCQFPQPPPAA